MAVTDTMNYGTHRLRRGEAIMSRRLVLVAVVTAIVVVVVSAVVGHFVFFKGPGPVETDVRDASVGDTSLSYALSNGRVVLVVWKDFPALS
jgi:hypothetical protein